MKKNILMVVAQNALLLFLAGVVLHGCGAVSSAIKVAGDASDVKTSTFDFGADGPLSGQGMCLLRSVSKISDSSFVVGFHADSEKGVLMVYNNDLGNSWTTNFDMSNNESAPTVWYRKGRVGVVTERYDQTALTYVGRQFDAASGQIQSTKELAVIMSDGEDMDNRVSYYSYSPDSSYMLIVMQYGEYKNSDDREDMVEFRAHVIAIPHDFSSVRRENITVLVQEDGERPKWPGFAINNRGDVFCASYDITSDDSKHTLIRLPAKGRKPDTLRATFPLLKHRDANASPGLMLLNAQTDDVVTLAYLQNADNETACISVSKFDFASQKLLMNKNVVLTETELKELIDRDVLKNYRLLHCMSLADGGFLVVLDERQIHTVRHGSGLNSHVIGDQDVAGPVIVLRLNAEGNIIWKSSLKDRREPFVLGGSYENYPSFWLADKSLRMLHRTRNHIEGVSYAEFMLNNGEVRTATLPITYGRMAVYMSFLTQWGSDDKVSMISVGSRLGQIIKLKLPETTPYQPY